MPQKKSLRQIEKQQRRRDREGKKEKERVEKTIGSLDLPETSGEELMDQLRRMKAITPTSLANQFNIKVSTAKKLLEGLREDRVVELVSRSHNLKIYALASG
jgi:ribosomal protein S25